jgi:hypothetical protein
MQLAEAVMLSAGVAHASAATDCSWHRWLPGVLETVLF